MSQPRLGLLEQKKARRRKTERSSGEQQISRPVRAGWLPGYWPVVAGSGIALLVVCACLALAVAFMPKTERTVLAKGPPIEPTIVMAATPVAATFPAAAPRPIPQAPPSPEPPPAPRNVLPPLPAVERPSIQPPVDKILEDIEPIKVKAPPLALPAEPAELQTLPIVESFGTAVHFVRSPQVANRQAQAEDKLAFILHVSGNFEDPGFT